MSRRCWLLCRLVPWTASPLRRSYVGTPEEVKAYHEEKKRALNWVSGFQPRPWRRTPTDAIAIEYALCHHLFNPISRLPPNASQPFLEPAESLTALRTCQNMLKDLEPYFTVKNVIRCAERIAHILAYSRREIWCDQYEPCLAHLSQMIQLSLPRCTRSDLGTLIWSLGKWGPRSLLVELDEDTQVQSLVDRILERVCETGVKGELDNEAISNLLNGCVQLQILPSRKLLNVIFRRLMGTVEYIKGDVMSQLLSNLAQMKLTIPVQLQKRIAEVLETKLKAGSYPEKEIPFMLWSLREWHSGSVLVPGFIDVCRSAEKHRLEWTSMSWTVQHDVLMLQGFLQLRFFPSWHLLKTIHASAKNHAAASLSKPEAALFSVFAEFGVRSTFLLEQCVAKLQDLDHEATVLNVSSVVSLVRGLAVLRELNVDTFANALRFVNGRAEEMKPEDKEGLYFGYLHLKYFSDDAEKLADALRVDHMFIESCREEWRQCEARRHPRSSIDPHPSLPGRGRKRRSTAVTTIADGDLMIQDSATDKRRIVVPSSSDVFVNTGRLTGSALWRQIIITKIKCQ